MKFSEIISFIEFSIFFFDCKVGLLVSISEIYLLQGLAKTEPSGIVLIYGVVPYMEGFGHWVLVMVLVKEKPWNLRVEEDSF